jgi:hypothetical protein
VVVSERRLVANGSSVRTCRLETELRDRAATCLLAAMRAAGLP